MNAWNRTESIATLNSIIEGNIDEYTFKLARYLNKPEIDLRNYSEYSYFYSSGFSFRQDSDLVLPPQINVIKSVVDSLVSKLANNKTRPFFNPINGTYKTRQIVKQIQTFFDIVFDEIDVHTHITNAFKQAAIFDIGYVFIDPFTQEIYNLDTWCVSTLHTEVSRGHPTRMLVRFMNYPTTLLYKYDVEHEGSEKYVDFAMYIDTSSKEATVFINSIEKKTIKLDYDHIPLVRVFYNEPLFGNKTVSIVDELDGIQTQIDLINSKISACSQLTPGNVTYIYEGGGSSLKAADLNNRDGNVYGLDMPVGTSSLPVVNVNPAPFDPMWQNMLNQYVQQAYEIVGISQLSAQSKKPGGLDSGAALQTMADIESERFATQITHFVNAYVDLAKMMINTLPEDMDILPQAINISKLKWKDVKKQQEMFKIQYSAATALSKEPSEKLKQVMMLVQQGLIPVAKVAHYLDMPDLQDAYLGASAVQDGIDTVIQQAIDEGIYEIPEFVNYQQLAQEIAIQQNQLYACIGDDKRINKEALEALDRLSDLDAMLVIEMEEGGMMGVPAQSNVENTYEEGTLNVNQQVSDVQAGNEPAPVQEEPVV